MSPVVANGAVSVPLIGHRNALSLIGQTYTPQGEYERVSMAAISPLDILQERKKSLYVHTQKLSLPISSVVFTDLEVSDAQVSPPPR